MALLIPVVLALLAAWLVWRSRRSRSPEFLAHAEYWVYLPEAKMPPQDAVMTRLVQERPFGIRSIGAREALLFSDIRFHMALVRRERNPRQFRPDLFAERAEPTAAILEALARSQGLVAVRYVSEEPLRDDRHLRFLPHVAEAVATLGGGEIVYDVVSERFIEVESLRGQLGERDVAEFDFQVEVDWRQQDGAGHARTYGMTKRGLPELVAEDLPPDHETLARALLAEAARSLWGVSGELPEHVDVEVFGEGFRLVLASRGREEVSVTIRRRP